MTRIEKFRASIKHKDVEGNMTYLYTTFNGCKYGQDYQNVVMTLEDMLNNFVVFYYPFVEGSRS